MRKIVSNYLGCDLFEVSGRYYCTGRIYAMSDRLSELVAMIERRA